MAELSTLRHFETALSVLREPEVVARRPKNERDALVYNMGWMLGLAKRRGVSDAEQAEFIELVPAFLEYLYAGQTRRSNSLYMFWDLARDLPDHPPNDAIRDAFFHAFCQQLQSSNRYIQESALHGFGHLKDPRSTEIIAKFIESCRVGWLRKYANDAMEFQVM